MDVPMLSLIPAHNPPRPHCALVWPCSILCIFLTHLCTSPELLTPVPPTTNARQFPGICYKRYKVKISLPAAKTTFVIRISSFFRHWSLVIRHCPSPSDIKPSMKYLVVLCLFLSLSCGGSGTSVTQTHQPKTSLTSNPP